VSESCAIELNEGNYFFHTDGGNDPDKNGISWAFCDAHGGAETELSFKVTELGACVPVGKTYTASSGNLDAVSAFVGSDSDIQFDGAFEVYGLGASHLNDQEQTFLEGIMDQQLGPVGFFSDTVKIVSFTPVTADDGTETGMVQFQVHISKDHFLQQGFEPSMLRDILQTLKYDIQSRFDDGSVVESIRLNAKSRGLHKLVPVSGARLINFKPKIRSGVSSKGDHGSATMWSLVSFLAVSLGVIVMLVVRRTVAAVTGTQSHTAMAGKGDIDCTIPEKMCQQNGFPSAVPLQSFHIYPNQPRTVV